MTALLDTNILIGIMNPNEEHHAWCVEKLETYQSAGPALISDIIYCEFTMGMADQRQADEALQPFALERIRATNASLFRAGEAFKQYRAQGGTKTGVLPDFLIGAEAVTNGIPLVTMNARDFLKYFPELQIISPAKG